MPASENLTIECHQQDTHTYCGAACAQMVLDQIGAGLISQDDLYEDNNGHNSPAEQAEGWWTGPRGLEWTMAHRKPASFANTFVLFHEAQEETVSRKIIWTI